MKTAVKSFIKKAFFICAALALALSCGCAKSFEEREVFAMDTFMRLRAYGENASAGLGEAEAEIGRLSLLLSATDEKSEVYAIDHAGGRSVRVSGETFDIIKRSLAFSEEACGAFAITLRPALRAWGFTEAEYRVPDKAELEELLLTVGDGRVRLDDKNSCVTLPEGFEIDLGGAAKGYAADRAAELMTEAGVRAFLLDLGSSTILARGQKPDGSMWTVALKDPKGDALPAGVITFPGGAVSTSGGWERYFTGPDGTVYWHILDPATCAPARSGAISVTVLTDEAFCGDALSTALFVMGPERAAEYYRAHGDFDFIMFLEDGSMLLSPGMNELFTPGAGYENARAEVVK